MHKTEFIYCTVLYNLCGNAEVKHLYDPRLTMVEVNAKLRDKRVRECVLVVLVCHDYTSEEFDGAEVCGLRSACARL